MAYIAYLNLYGVIGGGGMNHSGHSEKEYLTMEVRALIPFQAMMECAMVVAISPICS